MHVRQHWTEEELIRDISGLDRLLARAAERVDPGSKCACSYLKQVLKDKRRLLATLKHHDAHGYHEAHTVGCASAARSGRDAA